MSTEQNELQAVLANAALVAQFTGKTVQEYLDSVVATDQTMSLYFVALLLQGGHIKVEAAHRRYLLESQLYVREVELLQLRGSAISAFVASLQSFVLLQEAAKGAQQ